MEFSVPKRKEILCAFFFSGSAETPREIILKNVSLLLPTQLE